jgi:anthranilate 1,2-dioxygenase (deaminating, decarboxylating) large subunit
MAATPDFRQCTSSIVERALDFRPEDGVYRISRSIFTDRTLFDLEMEHIFESTWIYACHESQIPNPNDFYSVQIGRQPMLVTRDAAGKLNALVNACQHRGTTLVRVRQGNQSTFTCPFHAWCYKSDGRLLKVKDPDQYGSGFRLADHHLKSASVESYKGFVFVNLSVNPALSLESFLGDAKKFFDLVIAQSPTGELEVIPGASSYIYDANWKLQNENGVDGYHVTTVHHNYIATVVHRMELDSRNNKVQEKMDVSKIGAGDHGWFAFEHGHCILFNELPNAQFRPGYKTIYPRLEQDYGAPFAKWAMVKTRNLNIYPSLIFMDQLSTQIRVVRPIAPDRTEIHSFCLGVKGESPDDRENRIRQFEDFFNVSGLGTPDDLVEFKEAQRGFEARLEHWSDISRGHQNWRTDPDPLALELDIAPVLTGTDWSEEGLFVNQHQTWQDYLLRGLQSTRFATATSEQ